MGDAYQKKKKKKIVGDKTKRTQNIFHLSSTFCQFFIPHTLTHCPAQLPISHHLNFLDSLK